MLTEDVKRQQKEEKKIFDTYTLSKHSPSPNVFTPISLQALLNFTTRGRDRKTHER